LGEKVFDSEERVKEACRQVHPAGHKKSPFLQSKASGHHRTKFVVLWLHNERPVVLTLSGTCEWVAPCAIIRMSRFGRLLQFFKDRVPFSARLPTALAQPQRLRKYADIQLPTVATATQHEPPPPQIDVVVLEGLTKQCVLLQLEYRDYLFKKTNIYSDQPEYVEKCYDLMGLVNADKPVKRDVSAT